VYNVYILEETNIKG